uniref:Oxidoreductase n=1 Tax=uncultured Thiotrichaceae bacterium TaxID=298394 RepID=A0A6S6TEB3_9GAMM|nr:MAG: Oxidoreductase [uncultured Thiotrichaceae bacterium]
MGRIRAMPADPGPAGWDAILPPRISGEMLTDQLQADYLIIGAGFAGLSAARRIIQLEPDARIIILEGCKVAEGPAGRNSGFMIDLPHDLASDDYAGDSASEDHRQTTLNRAAIRFAQEAVNEYGMPDEALVASGKINAAATAKGLKHNQDYARHLSTLDEDYKLLDAGDMRKLTGIDYYQGGLWTPGTVMLQPALYIRGLADGLIRHPSLQLFEQSPVVGLGKQKSGWLAQTKKGSVQADRVILAVNGLVQHFGYYPRRLMHVFTYASMTRALSTMECQKLGGEPDWAFTPADPLGTTVRRVSGTGGHRIIIRNRATYDPSMSVSEGRMGSVAGTHRQSFEARFPMLKDVEMEHCWGGRLCLSLNGVAALGEVDEGLYSACCQNGLGTAKGTVAGIVSAEQACGTTDTLLPEYQTEDVPKKLMPEPLMWLGANGVMRWKELFAGREL